MTRRQWWGAFGLGIAYGFVGSVLAYSIALEVIR